MKSLSLGEIALAVNGRLQSCNNKLNLKIKSISIDTRKEMKESLFIPVKGRNFDGHDFIKEAFHKGAVCALSEREIQCNQPYILVDSVQNALLDLAGYYRRLFKIKVIGITGSSGKTTTKDMIASVLSQKYHVVKTSGNFNNEVGLSLTIFEIDEYTEILVAEMGMNHLGEIFRLSKTAAPDICVITNIGVAHIENLGSREGIFRAKCEIFDFMSKNGTAILNGDDDMLITLQDKSFRKYYTSFLDKNDDYCYGYDFQNMEMDKSCFKADFCGQTYEVKMNYSGKFMAYNAMAAIVTGNILGLNKAETERGIFQFVSSGNRMKMQTAVSGMKIINDVYNANPSAVIAAMEVLNVAEGKKAAVLGDMAELGAYSEMYHYDTGKKIAVFSIDSIICVGRDAQYMFRGLAESGKNQIWYFNTKEEFFKNGLHLLTGIDVVLVKASRAMEFEKIVDKLTRC